MAEKVLSCFSGALFIAPNRDYESQSDARPGVSQSILTSLLTLLVQPRLLPILSFL